MIDMPTLEMVQTEHFRKSETRQMKERKKQREVFTANVQSCAIHFCQLLNTIAKYVYYSHITDKPGTRRCCLLPMLSIFMFFSYSTVPVSCLVQAFVSIGLAQASSSRPQPHELGFEWMVAETISTSWSTEATWKTSWKTSCHILSHLVVQTQVMHGDAVMAPKRCMLWRVQNGQQNEAWFACWRPSRQSEIIWCQRMAKASLRPGHG